VKLVEWKCYSLKLEVTQRVTRNDSCATVVTRNWANWLPITAVSLGTLPYLPLKMETVCFPKRRYLPTNVNVVRTQNNNNTVIFTILRTSDLSCVLVSMKCFERIVLHESFFIQLVFSVYDPPKGVCMLTGDVHWSKSVDGQMTGIRGESRKLLDPIRTGISLNKQLSYKNFFKIFVFWPSKVLAWVWSPV
jgi:hypothetical protein